MAVAVDDDDGGFDKKGNRRRGCAPKYVLHIRPLRQTGMPEALDHVKGAYLNLQLVSRLESAI